ncbi:MAG: HNH endonuclease signature motif containing protein [Phycisphaerae bacterium]|nr:HNH endonuclease signature motif containing protein [Phycisphaerae bacterium]MDD5239943.1 HNH endonuclease signature motif containing protein [Candidatus Nanoarchaeia archaeon]
MNYNQYTGNKPIEWIEKPCIYPELGNCFICTSHSRSQKGYPLYWWDKQSSHMSRFIWEQCFGTIPEGMQVLHACDVPTCINPEHLFLGTNMDNVQDKMSKHRHKNNTPKGEKHWWVKITKEIAAKIYSENGSQYKIALKYDVSQSTVSDIKRGVRWKEAINMS